MKENTKRATFRIFSGLGCIAALLALLWPSQGWNLDPALLFTFSSTFVYWIWLEVKYGDVIIYKVDDNKVKLSSHDLDLIEIFHQRIKTEQFDFLRNNDFGNLTPAAHMTPFRYANMEWRGIPGEFDNIDLRVSFDTVRNNLSEFVSFCAINLYHSDNMDFLTPALIEDELRKEYSQSTLDNISKINSIAKNLLISMEIFARQAKQMIYESH
jgi:hypothetical protein